MLLVYIILQTGEVEQGRLHEKIAYEAAANKAKTDLLFNMSHDIRTPMNAILGYTYVAIKHCDDQAREDDSLEKIKIAGGHLLNLINDILEMIIIAMSANAFEEDIQKSFASGINAHVAKPIDVKTLFETIQRLVK